MGNLRWSSLSFVVFVFFLANLVGCGGGGGRTSTSTPAPTATLTAITVSPNPANLALGLTQQLSATGTYSDGSTRDITSSVTWSSSLPSVATVSAAGLVTSKTEGSVTISAASGNGTASGHSSIAIGPAQLKSVAIDPPTIFVARGSNQRFTATGTFTDGTTHDVSATMSWNIKNHFVASGILPGSARSSGSTGSNSFTASTERNGFTTVSATDGHFSASAKLTVVSPARFAYVTNDMATESLSLYAIDSNTGDLHARGYQKAKLPTQGFPAWTDCVTLDPNNTHAYESNPATPQSQDQNVRIYSVDATSGEFTEIANSPMTTIAPLGCIQFEPSGKFGYALSHWNGTNQLLGYARDASTGALTELGWSPMAVGDSPTGLMIDPLGQYLYFVTMEINTGKSAALNGYVIDASTGALTTIAGMPFAVSNTATSVAIVHPSANFAYISHGGGNSVEAYSINRNTGLLTEVPGSTVTTAINPSALVFSVDGSYAYMNAALGTPGDPSSGTITTFRVDDQTGKLAVVGSVAAGTLPGALTIDPSGEFLYSSDNFSYIRMYKIQGDGMPKYVRSIATRPDPTSMALLPGDGPAVHKPTSLFVTTAGDNRMTGYSINSDGSLTLGNWVTTRQGPNSIALLPWGTQALVASTSSIYQGNLAVYNVPRASASPVFKTLLGDAQIANSAAMDPGESYAFQSDSAGGVLRTYGKFSYAGTDYWSLLSYLPSEGGPFSAFPAGAGAGPMAIVPSGRYVFVGNQSANSISVFAFWGELFETAAASTGSYGDGSPYSIGAKPIALVADPTGMYLYVVCGDNTLRTYAIDHWAGGHLKQVASVSLAAAPTSVTVDPSGHFAYVGDTAGNVSPFLVDVATGRLTSMGQTNLGAAVTALSIESSGHFAYVLCGPNASVSGDQGTIHSLSVNQDGTLTPIQGVSSWPANAPSALAFTDAMN